MRPNEVTSALGVRNEECRYALHCNASMNGLFIFRVLIIDSL